MKNIFKHSPSAGIIHILCALLLVLCLHTDGLRAQEVSLPLYSGQPIKINGLNPTICQASGATISSNAGFLPAVGTQNMPTSQGGYHVAYAGKPFTVTVDIPNTGLIPAWNNQLTYRYSTATMTSIPNTYYATLASNPPEGYFRFEMPVTFELGDAISYLTFNVFDATANPSQPGNWVIIPIVVLGPTSKEVPILGSTVQPQMPYLVLHAPPGDGSSSEFQDSKTTCREFTDSYAEDGSNSFNLAAKIGIAGSLGFIATVDYEFSVTFSGGATVGDMAVTTSSNQTCVTVGEGFATTEVTGPNGGGDVFIGYGTDLNLGLYPFLRIDSSNCSVVLDNGLIYLPTGAPRKFAYTKTAILAEMDLLNQLIADSVALGPKVTYNSLNQLHVWEQVLAMNDANVNNPSNVPMGADINFGSGVSASQESAITVVETNSIETEHYVEGNIGVEVVVEVGGSGVTGGYQYNTSKRFGKTQNQSNEQAQLIRYTLADDDQGDLFKVKVVRDPMYGTPIFRAQTGTKSSCPYQGGYQRDQPKLRHDGSTSDQIVSLGNPVGSSATFKLDLCNESNEARNYLLKLNANSNLNGAVVSAAGFPLNGNDLGQSFTVPAGGCKQDLIVEVTQLSANSPLAYPNLELFLYAPCEEDIQSSVFASVYFGNASGTNDLAGNISQLSVYPNPTSGMVNVAFELAESAPVRIQVLDLLGRLQTEYDLPANAGANQQPMDVSILAAGIYLLEIQSNGGRVTRKLVVE
jgi:hypothetical protein